MIITKLDAARRQLDAAIGLYFAEGDAVAIHTLVGAAHLLIGDLSKTAKQETLVQKFIRPDKQREFIDAIRAPQNFLKHADRDPEATRDLNPHATELMLFIEIETLRGLTGSVTDPMTTYLIYTGATWGRDAFEAPAVVLDGVAQVAAETSKDAFFSVCMEAIARRKTA